MSASVLSRSPKVRRVRTRRWRSGCRSRSGAVGCVSRVARRRPTGTTGSNHGSQHDRKPHSQRLTTRVSHEVLPATRMEVTAGNPKHIADRTLIRSTAQAYGPRSGRRRRRSCPRREVEFRRDEIRRNLAEDRIRLPRQVCAASSISRMPRSPISGEWLATASFVVAPSSRGLEPTATRDGSPVCVPKLPPPAQNGETTAPARVTGPQSTGDGDETAPYGTDDQAYGR